MKTALLHYWLTGIRGGEKVLRELTRLYPEADIFTHACNRKIFDGYFGNCRICETFISKLPGARRNCQKYLPLMFPALRQLDLGEYDLIISSESGPAKGIRKPPGARHICYCHTPMRYLWDMYQDYYDNAGFAGKTAMRLFKNHLRKSDLKSAESVDHFIANSCFVAERIKRIYNRDSSVIHPPVDVDFYSRFCGKKQNFYLVAGHLHPYKNPVIALEACRKIRRPCVVAGSGPLERLLRKEYTESNFSFTGRVSDEKLRELYGSARALIFPGIEDFGIVPLEAQAAGTPVIALGAGGALETVIEGKTGVFFDRSSADVLADMLLQFEKLSFSPQDCRRNAENFSPEVFRQKFRSFAANCFE
ncbi:MAG: glycosyltransferase [Lentisphaeria bacterium]|nr:glycosyltransferase [Lentisphaeria bacterium]